MILNLSVMISNAFVKIDDKGMGDHPNGVNVVYSDASVTFVSLDTPFNHILIFAEQLAIWQPNLSNHMEIVPHLDAYKFFDQKQITIRHLRHPQHSIIVLSEALQPSN